MHLLWIRKWISGLPLMDTLFFQPVREETDKELAKVRAKMLLPCVRRGIAPMMTCSPLETYWGWKLLDPTPEEAKLLGVAGDYQAHGIDHEDVKKVLTMLSKEGILNARQTMEAAKGAFSVGASPVFPPDVDTDAFGQIGEKLEAKKGNEQPNQDPPIGCVTKGTPTGETLERLPTRGGPGREAHTVPPKKKGKGFGEKVNGAKKTAR